MLGFYLVYKFLKFLMDKETIDLKKLQQGPGITLVDQMFARLQIPPPTMVQEKPGRETESSATVSLVFDRDQIASLQSLGISVPKVLCTCTRNYAKQAHKNLYEIACNKLAARGLDHRWAKKWKSNRDLSTPSMLPWKETIDEFVKKNMYYLYKVPGQCNLDDALYSVRIFGVRRDRVQSSEVLFSTWTSVDKDFSTLYAYSQFFKEVSTEKSKSLKEEVDEHFAKMKLYNLAEREPDRKQWIKSMRLGVQDLHRRQGPESQAPRRGEHYPAIDLICFHVSNSQCPRPSLDGLRRMYKPL